MHQPIVRFVLLVVLATCWGITLAQGTAGGKPKAPRAAERQDLAPLLETMTTLHAKTKDCHESKALQEMLLQSDFERRVVDSKFKGEYVRNSTELKVRFQLEDQVTKEGWAYVACRDKLKSIVDSGIGQLLTSVRGADLRSSFTAAVAQNLTAVDAIGTAGFDAELSKYLTQLNTLRLTVRSSP